MKKDNTIKLNKIQLNELENKLFERMKIYVDGQWKILRQFLLMQLSKDLHYTKEDKIRLDLMHQVMELNITQRIKEIEDLNKNEK